VNESNNRDGCFVLCMLALLFVSSCALGRSQAKLSDELARLRIAVEQYQGVNHAAE
jgi:hypothetical protein